MTLTEVKKVLRETQIESYNNTKIRLTPVQKFQVFESVLTNLLEAGTITQAQFKKWVNVY